MFLGFESIAVSNVVLTAGDLTIPARATGVLLQASFTGAGVVAAQVRYTMDNVTNPTIASGMILEGNDSPQQFLIEDLRRIRFIRNGAQDALLSIHYFAGRDV